MKTIRLLLILFLAAGLTSSRAQDTWTQKANFGGTARSGAAAFSIGDKGYLGTGSTPTVSALFKDFWEYDPAADTWTQKADFGGGERAAAVGLSINGKGYIGTGFSGSFWGTYYNDFWEYDPVTNSWTKKADFGGVPRSEAGGFTIGGKGYIGTGYTYTIGEYYSDFWEYDPASDVWTKKADFGGGDWADPTAFSIGNKGYMGTGWNNGLSASIYEYDPASDTWTKKANYGGGVIQYSVGFSIGNKGYIGTGGGVGSAIFYEYDPVLDTWTKKADYGGGGVIVAAGFSIGNKGYIGTGQKNGALKSFWEYTPDCNAGTTVYFDADADGYGDASNGLFVADCVAPIGYTYNSTDCNDANAAIHPGAIDFINGIDDDCNGIIDDLICNTPTGLITENITSTSVKFKWNYSATSYKLRYKVATTGTWTLLGPTGQTKTVEGLLANTKYVWQVKSVCNVDPKITSEWSAKQFFTTALLKTGDAATTSFELYPNPVSQSFTLDIHMGSTANPLITIYLLNALGQIIYSSQEITGNGELKKTITMPSAASSGWYIVRVVMSDQVMEQKLLYQQ